MLSAAFTDVFPPTAAGSAAAQGALGAALASSVKREPCEDSDEEIEVGKESHMDEDSDPRPGPVQAGTNILQTKEVFS